MDLVYYRQVFVTKEKELIMKVELIVPCYNESAVLQMFYDEAVKVVDSIEGYDLVLYS